MLTITPTVEEFRKIVSEYSYALFLKFKSRERQTPKLLNTFQKLKLTPPSQKTSKTECGSFGLLGRLIS